MFPWKERRPRMQSSYQDNVDDVLGGDSLHDHALSGIADEMMSSFKSGDKERLMKCLDLLCELCIAKYDAD